MRRASRILSVMVGLGGRSRGPAQFLPPTSHQIFSARNIQSPKPSPSGTYPALCNYPPATSPSSTTVAASTFSLVVSRLSFSSLGPQFTSLAAGPAFALKHTSCNTFRVTVPSAFTSRRTFASKKKKMPPKKEVKAEKVHLGRPGNNLKSGIVR